VGSAGGEEKEARHETADETGRHAYGLMFSLAVQGLQDTPESIQLPERPLRPYQKDAVDAVCERLATEQSTMLVLATGLGKTRCAAEIIKRTAVLVRGGRWLFLAHMDQLVDQALRSLERDLGPCFELEQAEWKADPHGTKHVVASVQSLMREERLERFAPDAFTGIIADEGHHYNSKSFSSPFRRFPNAKRVFITATPDRRDKRGYKGLCDSVAYRMELGDWRADDGAVHLGAISRHWATPVVAKRYTTDQIDLDVVGWSKGDFVAGQLDDQIAKSAATICEAALTLCGDRSTAIFCPGVKSAHAAADAINEKRPGSTMAIDGSMDKAIRRQILRDFKAHKFQFLSNCLLLTEGFDFEELSCMIDAAPTSSRGRAVQKLGRITRLYPGIGTIHDDEARQAAIASSPKPSCLVVDLAFNSSKHDLVGPVDVLGGAYEPAIQKLARKKLLTSGGSVQDALKRAAEEIARRKARAAAAAAAKVSLKEHEPATPPPKLTAAGEHALEPWQEQKLRSFNIPYDETTTKKQATKLIRSEYLCKSKGLVRYEQREFLARWVGLKKSWGLAQGTYRKLIDAWKSNQKRPLTGRQIAETIGAT
jgi:superfamily II DNA or RNA helicase